MIKCPGKIMKRLQSTSCKGSCNIERRERPGKCLQLQTIRGFCPHPSAKQLFVCFVSGPEEVNLKWYSNRASKQPYRMKLGKILQLTKFRKRSHCFSWSALRIKQVGNVWIELAAGEAAQVLYSNNHKLQNELSFSMHARVAAQNMYICV